MMAKREMTEEQKKANAERLKAAREKKAAEKAAAEAEAEKAPFEEIEGDEVVPTKEKVSGGTENATKNVEPAEDPMLKALREQNELLQKQIEAMQAQMASLAMPKVIQVAADTEKVHFLWQAPVADDNVVLFGEGGMYGRITGKTGSFFVPKSELSRILDSMTRLFLEKRWLLVLDGLDDDEREALGIAYKDGEVLDKRAFAKMVDLGDEILEIFPLLCDSHKEMVGQRFYEAWVAGNKNVKRETVVELLKMSKAAGVEIKGFSAIIEEMNAADLD